MTPPKGDPTSQQLVPPAGLLLAKGSEKSQAKSVPSKPFEATVPCAGPLQEQSHFAFHRAFSSLSHTTVAPGGGQWGGVGAREKGEEGGLEEGERSKWLEGGSEVGRGEEKGGGKKEGQRKGWALLPNEGAS